MLTVGIAQGAAFDRRIDLRRGDVRMPEHLLDGTQVSAARQEVRRKGVPQQVRLDWYVDPRARGGLLHTQPKGLPGQGLTAGAEENGAPGFFTRQCRTALL
jgi:hypothetical protein